MSEFIIHTIPGSPFARAVMVALEEKEARYRVMPIAAGAHKAAAHLARQPFGRMPAIEHGDFSLYETQAILRYVDRVMPGRSMIPVDPRNNARMDQLMNMNDWYLFQGVANIIAFQRIVGPRLMGLTPDEAVIETAMPNARVVFRELSTLLGVKSFFVGSELTLADVLIAPQMDFFRQTPEWQQLVAPHKNIEDWLSRMVDRPSMKATTWERLTAQA